MSNRINYLKVELGRKKQLANIAKNKYHKMMEARNKSVFEKK